MIQHLLQVQYLLIDFNAEGSVTNAVKNISFNVEAGEILAIVGESGSGKSVTALSLMQLLPQQAKIKGQILFSNKEKAVADLLTISSKEINTIRGKEIAMIFQEPMTSLNPVFTCGYQVMEAMQLHQHISSKAAREKTIALFEKVKLPNPSEMVDRYPHQLSGGQKQRVMIAMAMSCNPSLLIADEPTTALDVTVQKTILQLLKELQLQTGMGIIFITHDLGLVADIADKVLVMYKGEIIEQGQTKDVLQNPQQPYTKALLACRPTMHKHGERLPVVSDFFTADPKVKLSNLRNFSFEEIAGKKNTFLPNSAPITQNVFPENNQPELTLKVDHLKVYYPSRKLLFKNTPVPFKAVDDVSFTVCKGETVGLVGESGCGKTTLGRAVLQLIPTTSGDIILNGKNLAALPKNQMRPLRKELQIVFQDPYGSLNPRLMIGNAIMEPMKIHGILNNTKQRKEKVVEFLEKVNLSADHFTRYPHQFSGGQRQRICIARALVLNPSFLIFDESVSALDVSVQAQVLNLINDLKKEFGFTSIFISHDLSVVRYISDRILVMNKGKIVEEGAAEEVYLSPKNEYTKKLIGAIPGETLLYLIPYFIILHTRLLF
jgi:peptide/nickel transport system ATP-binding protein